MDTRVNSIKSASCGISAVIAKAPLVGRNQGCSHRSKPDAVTKTPATLDNLLPVAMDVTRKDQDEVAALLPTVALVFTVGGPLVYQGRDHQFGNH
jgi:hypothetical protein